MPNVNPVKNLTTESPVPTRSKLSRLVPGMTVRLREGVYRQIKEREWTFNKMDREGIHLTSESKAYGLIVSVEDIDWSEFYKKNSHRFKGRKVQ